VGPPRVSHDPVLSSVLYTEADNRDVMNDVQVTGLIPEDAAGVSLEGIGHSDTASDGAALVDLLQHLVLTRHRIELVDSIDVVGVRNEAGLMWLAVLADINRCAFNTVVMAASLIDRAGLICHIGVVHEFESAQGITAVATIVILRAGDHHLGGDVDIGPLSLAGDLDAVGKC